MNEIDKETENKYFQSYVDKKVEYKRKIKKRVIREIMLRVELVFKDKPLMVESFMGKNGYDINNVSKASLFGYLSNSVQDSIIKLFSFIDADDDICKKIKKHIKEK